MIKKKKLATLLALGLATSILFTGCGSSNDTDTTTTSSSDSTSSTANDDGSTTEKELIEIDWYIAETWFSPAYESLASQLIEEQTGIKINFITPIGDANEQTNLFIASNSLPDLVTMGWWNSQVQEISIPEYSYSYNELMEMAPELGDQLEQSVLDWYKSDDGYTYAYPCYSVSDSDFEAGLISNRTFLVRKDIYEAIGSPDMRTQEGFLQALEDAKAMFPEALNGDPLIPFGTTEFTTTGNAGLEDTLLEFLAVPREVDGNVYPVVNGFPDDDYISWLKTFREAHERGLISVDIFIDDRTLIEEKIQQGRYFALLYQAKDAMSPLAQLYANNPDSIYIAVDGPANSNLDSPQLAVPGYSGWEVTFVSKNTEHAERIAELLAWGFDDERGQIALYLGQEGVTYDVIDGKEVIKAEVDELKNNDFSAFKEQYNTYYEYWMFGKTSSLMNWEPDPVVPFDQYEEWGEGKAAFYGVYDNIAPPADSDEAEIGTKVNIKWGEILPKLIQADSDATFDTLWGELEAYKESVNYDLYLDYIRERVVLNKAKMQ
ncbi:MAG: ABC transporter substrate-binding protein [Eubacteriales bacterium]